MKKIWRKIYHKYLDARLQVKMIFLFFVILLLITCLMSLTYQTLYHNILDRKVRDMAGKSLSAITNSMETLIRVENNYSKLILSDKTIQNGLKQPNGLKDPSKTRDIILSLTSQLEINSLATSVYIIDTVGNRYGVDRRGLNTINIENSDIRNLPWYQEAAGQHGGYILVKNGGGIFSVPDDQDFISLIRFINDLDDFSPLGIMIMNIPISSIIDSSLSADDGSETSLLIQDEQGQLIASRFSSVIQPLPDALPKILEAAGDPKLHQLKLQNVECILTSEKLNGIPWTIISVVPMRMAEEDMVLSGVINLVMIILTGLCSFLAAILISRHITRPIGKLLDSMSSVEQGIFHKVELSIGNDEIGQLKYRYNIMVERIGELFQKTLEDQQLKQKAELNLLQAQINPHFLYNTLDSIRSLTLLGNKKYAYYTVKALEDYYRTCLSNGAEVISIAEEVDSVKNYLRIQRVRYGKLFVAEYDLDPTVQSCQVVKLILQPLAENSLYHGIKPLGSGGIIHISTRRDKHKICLCISDNGAGIPQELIDSIMNRTADKDKIGFGLRGTIERLRIYYGDACQVIISSKLKAGTRIEIWIPDTGGEREDGRNIEDPGGR